MSKKKRNTTVPIFIIVGGGLLLLVVAFLLSSQNTPAVPTPAVAVDEDTYPEIQRVSLEDAKAALDGGSAVFVDVRAADAYGASHVADALNLPLAEIQQRLGELDKAQWIITYCT